MQTMQKPQTETRVEMKSQMPDQHKSRPKSRFNDAEYERWSAYLQSGKNGKSKNAARK